MRRARWGKIGWVGLLLLVAGSGPAWGQSRGKISGTVTDATTGEPLPGVNVVIDGTTIGTSADVQGDYFIANLEPGTYAVRATFVGYKDMLVTGVDVRSGGTTDLDVQMEEVTVELGEEVVVTATRPLVEQDNTTSVVRLDAEEVTARPTTDFLDVLSTLPSVDDDQGQVTVRGGGLDEVAFLVDGARARNPLNFSPYTRINLSAIQELEVITGSFNAEYGEAQSGVINVVTKEGGDRYEFYLDTRYEPPGLKHWGVSLYDPSSTLYWENTHARHLEWWIEYPDQWVDPNGVPGSDPRSEWTPEEAYRNYLDTHRPLNDYEDLPSYQVELGVGGPAPLLNDLRFFVTAKRRSEAPLLGTAYRDRGVFTDGTAKLSYRFGGGKKLLLSGFYGEKEAGWGFAGDDDYLIGGYPFWAEAYGIEGRYAYFDQAAYPYSQTNGQTLQFSHVLSARTLYELKLIRVQALRRVDVFPDDPIGFAANRATRDNLRAFDDRGNPVSQIIGYNVSGGYLYRYHDSNTEWRLEGNYSSQFSKFWHLKTGLEFSYYRLDHFNQAKFPSPGVVDDRTYKPYQGALYADSKLEFGGLIMNAGLRFDFYNPNDTVYTDLLSVVANPFEGDKLTTKLYAQLSPRLGISHPIDENTVLHFSYGHFFQRPSFNDYGEQGDGASGSLNTLVTIDGGTPVVLGNRELRPRKTIAYEVGIERNFWDFFVLDLTGYYKDYRNTITGIQVTTQDGNTYKTTGNADYADFRGVEFSLRKVPSTYDWGSIWGYANFTTQFGISGKSNEPIGYYWDEVEGRINYTFPTSGDAVQYYNPRFKAGLYYETPSGWQGLTGALLSNLSLSLDYRAVFPNADLRQDIFVFGGQTYMRPVDQLTDLRAVKEVRLGRARLSPYLEVHNLFNNRWLNLFVFERAADADKQRFVESGFDFLPSVDADGVPILDIAKFRNLPRSVSFGLTVIW